MGLPILKQFPKLIIFFSAKIQLEDWKRLIIFYVKNSFTSILHPITTISVHDQHFDTLLIFLGLQAQIISNLKFNR
jgi:hypothetical protein